MSKIPKIPRVIIESPFAGDVDRNIRYLQLAMRFCLLRGEAPYASHALYTQPNVLDDDNPEERMLGIHAGFQFRETVSKTVVFTNFGISSGMVYGIDHAMELKQPIEFVNLIENGSKKTRTIYGWDEKGLFFFDEHWCINENRYQTFSALSAGLGEYVKDNGVDV